MRALVLLAALLAPATARAEWGASDTALQATYGSLVLADYLQTRSALEASAGREANPILGDDPLRIGLTMAGLFAAHTTVAVLLPRPARRVVQFAGIAVSGAVVARAAYLGYGISF